MQIDRDKPQQLLILIVSLLVGLLMSFGLCIAIMRTLVGAVALPGSSFGVSRPNFLLASLAATIVASVAAFMTSLVFFAVPPRWKWAAIVPAVFVPVLGVIGFAIFLMSRLS